MTRTIFTAIAAIATTLSWSPLADAQVPVEVEVDKSAAADLYVTRRPAVPVSPKIPKELETLLVEKEKRADGKRAQAIKLLREFLKSNPTGQGKAEGMFKLSELLWEEGRRVYVQDLEEYERKAEACRVGEQVCDEPPPEPKLSLRESEALYKRILAEHTDYARTDLVLYLTGFAVRQRGDVAESIDYFRKVIEDHPKSRLYADSWMMVAEAHFQAARWSEARDAYAEVLTDENADSFDLALFKNAWCDWKLGDPQSAAKKFKRVLDLAEEARKSGTRSEIKRREQLRDEALDYLVVVFSEDESIKAKDVYSFLASIGGERYSEAVLGRLAEAYLNDAEYDRSVETYKFLIELHPSRLGAAKFQRKIVDAYLEALDGESAMTEIKVLVEKFGKGSDWAKANKRNRDAVKRTIKRTESLVRGLGKKFHAEAQQFQKQRGSPNLKMYTRAANVYEYYLGAYEDNENAAEVRYLRAEILFFKLTKYEQAGDEYLKVGKTAPVGEFHKDALLKAMEAFKRIRPKGKRGRELAPVDKKFAEATDLYATLFPGDKAIVGVIYENGQLFYDYGNYDEAIKRFGLIITKFPDHESAGAAGDRILDALNKAEDFENIEEWARKLKKSKAFASRAEQDRLDRLVVDAIVKSGEKYSGGGKYRKAAKFYLRIPKEYPDHSRAPMALYNAAVNLEKAKRADKAAETYAAVAERYPDNKQFAEKSAFNAARLYESIAYFERAAEAYELVAKKWKRSENGATSLFNAGVLRQALGQPKKAIKHYESYAKRFRRSKKDAEEVAFRIGVVYEDAGQDGRAGRAFDSYVSTYRSGQFALEALTRSGRALFGNGRASRSERKFKEVLSRYKRLSGEDKKANARWAAESQYYLGEVAYKQFEKLSLDVKPRKLKRTLDKKGKLLGKAQDLYLEVIDFGDPQWSTAALFRIGSVFEQFAISLRDAPPPPGFTEDEKTMYRDQLEEYVIEYEEKATELYMTGYNKALELKVYNSFTKKLRQALGRLAASRFPPESEAREGLRQGDRTPTLPAVEEVVRGE